MSELFIEDNQVSDLSALAGMTKLEWLYAGENAIADISALAGLTELYRVDLSGNLIADISALTGLHGLRSLDLRDNPLNEEAYTTYLPLIQQNNPGVWLYYDPIPEPSAVVLVTGLLVLLLGGRRDPSGRRGLDRGGTGDPTAAAMGTERRRGQ